MSLLATNAPPELRELLRAAPVFDAHTDALQLGLDLGHDLAEPSEGQFDLARGQAGGLGAVVLVSWVDPGYLPEGAQARARALMEAGLQLAERRPDRLRIVRRAGDLARAREAGAVAGVLGIEGGHALERGVESLEAFHELGLRVLTLVWNNSLPWIRSCEERPPPGTPEGLSDAGRAIVGRMDELGIVCDLSHAGERSFFDALAATRRPVIASHSGCRALHDHPRNLTDAQLEALAANDGVVGIVFHPPFLDAEARAAEAAVRARPEYGSLGEGGPFEGSATARYLAQGRYMAREAPPFPLERLLDHVEHALRVAGPRHVGLGSDFDGIQRGPVGLGDAGGYWRVARGLLARGHAEEVVRGVLGGNMERVLEAVLPG